MKTILVLLGISITLLSTDAFARRYPTSVESNKGRGPFTCDNGRTYQIQGRSLYIDGILVQNGLSYEFRGAGDSPDPSLYENGYHTANCQPVNPPPAPAPRKRWNNYVKVCDGQQRCHYESEEIQ